MLLKNISKKVILTLALVGIATPSFANTWGSLNVVAERLIVTGDARLKVIRKLEKVEAPQVQNLCAFSLQKRDQACNALIFACGWLLEDYHQNGENLTALEWQSCYDFTATCEQKNDQMVAACEITEKPASEHHAADCTKTCAGTVSSFDGYVAEITTALRDYYQLPEHGWDCSEMPAEQCDRMHREIRLSIQRLVHTRGEQAAHCDIH